MLPQIAGVASHNVRPQIEFSDGFAQLGQQRRASTSATSPPARPTSSTTCSPGSRRTTPSRSGSSTATSAGTSTTTATRRARFTFGRGATGLLGDQQREPHRQLPAGRRGQRQRGLPRRWRRTTRGSRPGSLHVGDTWRVNSKLTLNYGLRWDYFTPSREKYNRLLLLRSRRARTPAPEDGRAASPSRATEYGAASYGADYPEKPYKKAFAPRLGVTYALNPKTLVRAGWGIFYDRAFYPGWGGGISQDGFSSNVAFSSSPGRARAGLPPAGRLPPGLHAAALHPVRLPQRPGHLRTARWTPTSGPRSQQWNLTLDREIAKGFMVGLAYVGSRGTHLPSNNDPLNALDPVAALPGQRSSTTSSSRGRPRSTACPSPTRAGASR